MSDFDWQGRSVLVTGGAGFLGRFVVDELERRGADRICVPRSAETDLRCQQSVRKLFEKESPDIVLHLAARVGGIGANRDKPGTFFYDNLAMGMELLEAARRRSVEKFVTVGTICSYPENTPVPFREDELWNGYPEPTNAPYGIAKKALLTQTNAYRDEFGFHGVYLLVVNLYGPRDNFDLETSHVIPALIRKFEEAKDEGRDSVTLWGNGTPTREFLYVEDAARAIVMAAENYDQPEPINLGTGQEISIRTLAETVARLVGFDGELIWDTTRPNGQMRRCLDVSRAKSLFGFEAETDLETGLRKTIDWYVDEFQA